MKNSKHIHSINRIIDKITSDTFDEHDIKILLIDIREHLKKHTLLREIADFIAHPQRSQGICHSAVDSRYARMKMMRIGTEKIMKKEFLEEHKNKPESFFNNIVLDYLNPIKISAQDYSLFVEKSLEDINDDVFLQYYKITQAKAKDFIKESYAKENGYYILKEMNPKRLFVLIDILRFVRGIIVTSGILTQENITKDLKNAFAQLNISRHNLSDTVFEPIIVCIFALLHDVDFVLYDGKIAKCYLSFAGEEVNHFVSPPTANGFYFCLCVNSDNFVFPIATTNISYDRYIDKEINPYVNDMQVIPWVYTKRCNGKLKLVENIEL